MKFYAVRTLKLLIGLTIAAMLYLSFKMHTGSSSFSNDFKTTNIGFISLVKNIFRGDLTNFFAAKAAINLTTKRSTTARPKFSSAVPVLPGGLLPVNTFRSFWKKVPYHRHFSEPDEFANWRLSATRMCDGFMIGYNDNFLYTNDMIINREFCKCKRLGGESIESVIMQNEDEEYYKYEMGCFRRKCSSRPKYDFNAENHLNDWMMSLSTETFGDKDEVVEESVVQDFTIAITRYEYANVYHTMTDWYNAFLVKEFFNRTSFDTNILFIDAHPSGNLDRVWNHLFNSTARLSSLPVRTRFNKLAWGILGYNSPMGIFITDKKLPLFEEFRSFFLDSYGIKEADLPRHNCKAFNILFIWRHDYVAHPRNPKGSISRKIANEMELVNYLKLKLPREKFQIKGSQIDVFEMKEQLNLVTWADILIGMHGAGLTHTLFLKHNSSLIELSPNYMFGEQHFAAIAKWRNVVYNNWSNADPLRELPDKSTIVPPSVVLTLIKKSIKDLCSRAAYHALFPKTTNN